MNRGHGTTEKDRSKGKGMDRDELIKLGLTEDQAIAAIDLHKKTLNGKYIPKGRFDEVNTELTTAKQTLTERQKQLQELEASAGDNAELVNAIQALKEENAQKDASFQQELSVTKKRGAVAVQLLDEVHDADLVVNLLDLKAIEVASDGTVAGLDQQLSKLKESKPFLFVKQNSTQKKNSFVRGQEPPTGTGTGFQTVEPTPEEYGKQLAARKKNAVKAMTNASDFYFKTR